MGDATFNFETVLFGVTRVFDSWGNLGHGDTSFFEVGIFSNWYRHVVFAGEVVEPHMSLEL